MELVIHIWFTVTNRNRQPSPIISFQHSIKINIIHPNNMMIKKDNSFQSNTGSVVDVHCPVLHWKELSKAVHCCVCSKSFGLVKINKFLVLWFMDQSGGKKKCVQFDNNGSRYELLRKRRKQTLQFQISTASIW